MIQLFFKNERNKNLYIKNPPYGYRLKDFYFKDLKKFKKNASIPPNKHYKTCAVVGNSGSLLNKHYGKEIDSHEAVFRVNYFHLKSKYSGTKTTWSVLASPSYISFKAKSYKTAVLCNRPYIYSCHNILFNTLKPTYHMINPIFYEYVYNKTNRKKKIPLTGTVAVYFAMKLCKVVNVYGFTVFQEHKCAYYWNCQRTSSWYMNRNGSEVFHDFYENSRLLIKLNKSLKINFK